MRLRALYPNKDKQNIPNKQVLPQKCQIHKPNVAHLKIISYICECKIPTKRAIKQILTFKFYHYERYRSC